MTEGSDQRQRNLCELIVTREELLRVLDLIERPANGVHLRRGGRNLHGTAVGTSPHAHFRNATLEADKRRGCLTPCGAALKGAYETTAERER